MEIFGQLFHEERIAIGAHGEEFGSCRRQWRLEHLLGAQAHPGQIQPTQVDSVFGDLLAKDQGGRFPVVQVPGSADHRKGRILHVAGEQVQEIA